MLYDATAADDLANAVRAARAVGIPFFVLGLGANILIGDRGFRGLVIRNTAGQLRVPGSQRNSRRQWCHYGRSHSRRRGARPLRARALRWYSEHRWRRGLAKPAFPRARAWTGAHDVHRGGYIRSVELLTPAGARLTVPGSEMQFGYDTSRLHHSGEIALAVTFDLAAGDRPGMQRVMQENLSWRGSRHPWLEHHPSAGSIFKKIEGVGAGRLIDQCGLKGYAIGGAQISHMHANIMVNTRRRDRCRCARADCLRAEIGARQIRARTRTRNRVRRRVLDAAVSIQLSE